MKILVLSSLYPNAAQPRHGIFIEHRVAHLAQRGDEIRVVAPVPWFPSGHAAFGRYAEFARAPREAERRGLSIAHPRYPVVPKVGTATAPWLMAAALYPQLVRLRRDFDFDVIDAYYLYPDGVAASLLARRLDRPLVMTALGSDVSLIARRRAERAMILAATRRASAVTTVCAALRDELLAIGADGARIHTLEHGVDLDLFAPPADRAAARLELGFGGPILLSVGHLDDNKGHDLAIRATAMLPGTRLMIAGEGPRRPALQALAAELGVADRVTLTGLVDQRRLAALYGAADVTLNCSAREGIANVLLESLACGTPLVATPVWGSPEVVRVAEAGRLAAGRSAPAIAGAVAELLAAMPDRAATRRYAERYDWSDTGRRHRALLADAVAGYRALRQAG